MNSAHLPSSPMLTAVVVLLGVVGLCFVAYCEVDIARARRTRWLPRLAWAAICVITIPLGGIAYLLLGRPRAESHQPLR